MQFATIKTRLLGLQCKINVNTIRLPFLKVKSSIYMCQEMGTIFGWGKMWLRVRNVIYKVL